ALWPFVTLGWPENTQKFQEFFPTNLLVTGFDIIFFWVARMIIFSLKFTGKIPFKTIYIHGIIQDQDGQKMSKTRGNVIDPIDLVDGISLEELIIKRTTGLMQPQYKKTIEQKTKQQFPKGINNFGTDALRFTFCAIATHNRHIKFELARLEGYRNFCNKLWNAARFLLLHVEGQKFDLSTVNDLEIEKQPLELKWILSIWQTVKFNFTEHLNNYRFDLASKDIYDFVWNEYCDWFLEFSKIHLFDINANLKTKHNTKLILIYIFDEILKVLHLIMPYITEEIWHNLQEHIILDQKLLSNDTNHNLIILLHQKFPEFNKNFINLDADHAMLWVKNFITTVRNLRSTINLPNSVKLPVVFV
ncbi:MAG: class I tRNA ligase family protein, partial [Gammaproteobacteria bacterium]